MTVMPSEQSGADQPWILVLPGGAYHGHASHEGADYGTWLSALGFNVVVLRYATGVDAWPRALQEARAALGWMRARAASSVRSQLPAVGVIGSSAGGHLAAALSTATCPEIGPEAGRPDFCVLAYPLISFEVAPHQASADVVLGQDNDAPARRRVSVEHNVDPATPPTFVWTTADDASVPIVHTLRYVDALARSGVQVAMHVFPRGVHGLGLAEGDPVVGTWPKLCEAWLRSLGVSLRARGTRP